MSIKRPTRLRKKQKQTRERNWSRSQSPKRPPAGPHDGKEGDCVGPICLSFHHVAAEHGVNTQVRPENKAGQDVDVTLNIEINFNLR